MRVGSVLANGFKELSKSPNQWKSSAKEDNWLGGKDIRWMVHIYDPTIFLKCMGQAEHSPDLNSADSGEVERVEGKI